MDGIVPGPAENQNSHPGCEIWHTGGMPYWFDGNSLVGQPSALLRADRETRRAFLANLSLRTVARGGRFTVFFDGDDPDRSMPPKGIQVRYSAPRSADEAILHNLSGTRRPAEIIVVSNDHGLLSQCRAVGAQGMTWPEFENATRRRQPAHRGSIAKKEEEVKIEEWARFFGLDSDALE